MPMQTHKKRKAGTVLIVSSIIGFSAVDALSVDCELWQVRQVDTVPDWYATRMKEEQVQTDTASRQDLFCTSYKLSESSSVVYLESREGVPCEHGTDWCYYGRLYSCDRDTTLLDSCEHGFTQLSFDGRRRHCVAGRIMHSSEDGEDEVIVLYNIDDHSKVTLSTIVRSDIPRLSPNGEWVAYSDIGNLYLYSVLTGSTELLFQRGGSFLIGGPCMYQGIGDICWSEDSKHCVFKYRVSISKDDYELYEAYLPDIGEARDTAAKE